jgi:hypothetical protein
VPAATEEASIVLYRTLKTRASGAMVAFVLSAAAGLPATALGDADVRVLTGAVGGVDQFGVVELKYNTTTRVSITFEPGASTGAEDDSMRIDALDSSTDLTPGSGCHDESPTRVRCDGVFSPSQKFDVLRTVTIGPAIGGVGATNDVFKLNGLFAPAANPHIITGAGDDLVDLSNAEGGAGNVSAPYGPRFEVDTGPGNDEVIEGARGIQARLGTGDDIVRPRRNLPPQAIAVGGSISEFDGGDGFDVVDESGRARSFRIDLRAGTIRTSGMAVDDLEAHLASIENAVGSGGNDTIKGTNGDNRLIGGAGADTLEGLGGDDRLAAFLDELPPANPVQGASAETDRDTLDGGSGADVLNVSGDGLRDFTDCGADGMRQSTAFLRGQLVSFSFIVGDTVFADLVDTPKNCESIQLQAKEERGTVLLMPLSKGLPRSRRLRVQLHCPVRALTNCVGRVGFKVGAGSAEPGPGAVGYSLHKGARRTVTIVLPNATRLTARTQLRLVAREKGRSRPRTQVLVLNSGGGIG